ncbi:MULTISPECIES: hypothetical protein [unclassified Pseudoalteromonas]|uniref:hypothetical protein n=1 Tax=unclassified Pseudoalteromonas TaxID=194690 RepID=UPI000C081E30|nr:MULTISPECIES: hypothetical protein [unclassified Pseudoalteromonas]MDB2355914.1 hypothetical protein [Pseudoalteromonas sp.]MDP2635151.1 hypothetical protein [Pseudoalteromonas sp. 1_MG-2023]PHN91508.1 hypothetical protein CSC79_00240 [Pseudoalteromonas sp. 3D05]
MTVNWQGVFLAAPTQFNASDAIKFATTAKMIDELNNEGVHSIIELDAANENTTAVSLFTQAMTNRIALTKFKLD